MFNRNVPNADQKAVRALARLLETRLFISAKVFQMVVLAEFEGTYTRT